MSAQTNEDGIPNLNAYKDLLTQETKKEEINVKFSGDVFKDIQRLRSKINIDINTDQDLVAIALTVLIKSEDKIIQIIDPKTNTLEKLHLWKGVK